MGVRVNRPAVRPRAGGATKQSKRWLTAALQMALLLAAVACATPWLGDHESTLPTLLSVRRSENVPLATSRARAVYNRSVVPGGVSSADELKAVMAHDPVVADHYRAAAVNELRPVTLTAGRAAYVSYRIDNHVYWTRKRVWIRAGETVLTDGTTTVRARCGNCISDRPMGPVAAVDPAPGELDDFVVPPTGDGSPDWLAEESHALGDLLEVPFGPQIFADAMPDWRSAAGDTDHPFGGIFQIGGGPGIVVPGTWNPETPAVFLPPGGGTTTGTPGTTSGTSTGAPGTTGGVLVGGTTDTTDTTGSGTSGSPLGVTTATPGDTATTGVPGGTTTGDTSGTTGISGTTSGWPTSGAPGGDTPDTTGFPGCCSTGTPRDTTSDGSPTSGHPFPTTGEATTTGSTSSHPSSAPEPEVLWLVACGVIGLASRSWRRR